MNKPYVKRSSYEVYTAKLGEKLEVKVEGDEAYFRVVTAGILSIERDSERELQKALAPFGLSVPGFNSLISTSFGRVPLSGASNNNSELSNQIVVDANQSINSMCGVKETVLVSIPAWQNPKPATMTFYVETVHYVPVDAIGI